MKGARVAARPRADYFVGNRVLANELRDYIRHVLIVEVARVVALVPKGC
jgi:hypothetical protein